MKADAVASPNDWYTLQALPLGSARGLAAQEERDVPDIL